MNKQLKWTLSIVAVILVLNTVMIFACPMYPLYVLSHFPSIAEKVYPDYLSVDGYDIEYLKVTDDCVSFNIENFDSAIIIKRVDFKQKSDVLYVYVYKGFLFKETSFLHKVEHKMDVSRINRIELVGPENQRKLIWSR